MSRKPTSKSDPDAPVNVANVRVPGHIYNDLVDAATKRGRATVAQELERVIRRGYDLDRLFGRVALDDGARIARSVASAISLAQETGSDAPLMVEMVYLIETLWPLLRVRDDRAADALKAMLASAIDERVVG